MSSYVTCKKTLNLLQEKANRNCVTADKKYYPLVAMTLALDGGTAITFLGYTSKPTAYYFTLLFQTDK